MARLPARHIWLIGMMGTGKTTVGAIVAERTGRRLVDTDTLVMERTGRTIPELFAEGEDTFRSGESAVVTEVAAMEPSVVSTGGGVILDDGNVAAMRRSGILVLLEAHPDEIERRIATDGTRPLVTDAADVARVSAERFARYRSVCDAHVPTDDKDPETVADEVMACVDI